MLMRPFLEHSQRSGAPVTYIACPPLPSQMLIIPPQLGLYMSLAPEQKLTYPLGGPSAQAAFEAGLAGFEARSFRGLGVFTSTPVRFLPTSLLPSFLPPPLARSRFPAPSHARIACVCAVRGLG